MKFTPRSIDLSKEQLQKIIDTSIDIICTVNEDGEFMWHNRASEAVWGYSPEELIGRKYLDLVFTADHTLTQAVAKEIMLGNNYTNFENHYYHKDGYLIPMVWSATWDREERIFHCVARNASDKKKAEQTLKESNELLQKALKVAKMGTWEFEVVSMSPCWSDELYAIYGFEKSSEKKDLVTLFNTCVHPDDAALVQEQFNNIPNNISNFSPSFIHRFIRPDGKTIYLKQSIAILQNDELNVLKVVGLAQDITEVMEQQTQLQVREQRFKAMAQSGADIIGIVDFAGNYIYASDNTKKVLDYEPDFFNEKNAFDFIHPEDAALVYNYLASLALEKAVTIKPFRFKNAAGHWRWLETNAINLINDPSIEGILVNSRDITEKTKLKTEWRTCLRLQKKQTTQLLLLIKRVK